MTHSRIALVALFVASLLTVGGVVSAEEEVTGPQYGDTYTAEELEALDRVLHAANMTRDDLKFRKDMTKGHACLPMVRTMLADPLRIAPDVDALAAVTLTPSGRGVLQDLLRRATGAYAGCWATPRDLGLHEPLWELADGLHPKTQDDLVEGLRGMAQFGRSAVDLDAPDPMDLEELRHALPGQMAWHDVFEPAFTEDRVCELDAALEDRKDAWLHDTCANVRVDGMVVQWLSAFLAPPWFWARTPRSLFPEDAPREIDTEYGRIALGTPGDDVYTGEYTILIDPGGNDRYVNCRIGAAYGTPNRRIGFFADLGGDDVYACGDVNITLGAAILGIAAFYDLGQGNDRYEAGHCSLGAAMGGVGVFYDDGGSDVYEGKTYTQGAAGFGIGIFYDDSVQEPLDVPTDEETPDPIDIAKHDNDRLHAWANAQAFARCRGVALCVNKRGNEIYEAGGVYLHAPLFSDRYQSFSQGFAIGSRGIDYAGGIAMLIDHEGNDRYLGDIYNQGVGYWYSAGLLWDGAGNDTYEMTQYGQGSGIHLAVGGLVDVSGHDTYVMHSGLGQGSSHDYAASILHDRAGNDRYLGNTSCNGAALTNSVGIHIDRAGNDTYAGRRKGSINFGRPARGFSSIGVLLDLAGKDDYLGIMKDDTLWRHTDIGVGWDTAPEPEEETPGGVTPAAGQPSGRAEVPEICTYEGELTQEVFDELWAISVRWEVGDNRFIVPKARERLIAFGPDILPMMDAKLEESASGLELRAYVGILKAFLEKDEAAVIDFLRRNAAHEVDRRKRVALYLTAELEAKSLEDAVVTLLGMEDMEIARRAAAALAKLRSHAGDEVLKTWLDPEGDDRTVQAALGTLLALESDVYADVRSLLDHPRLSIRTRLITLLVGHAAAYLDAVRADLGAHNLSDRARRSILEILIRLGPAPDHGDVLTVMVLLEHDDWGVRADAVRLLRRWADDEATDLELLTPALVRLEELIADERDPYVLFCYHDGK